MYFVLRMVLLGLYRTLTEYKLKFSRHEQLINWKSNVARLFVVSLIAGYQAMAAQEDFRQTFINHYGKNRSILVFATNCESINNDGNGNLESLRRLVSGKLILAMFATVTIVK